LRHAYVKGENNPSVILTEREVRQIRKYLERGWPIWKIAEKYVVGTSTISRIKHRQTWSHVK